MHKVYYIQVQRVNAKLSEARMTALGNFINVYESTYLLSSKASAKEIFDLLSADLNNPTIMVMKCDITQGSYFGRANKAIWEWIDQTRAKLNQK